MTPQELKASILQQAVQGKLVEQCSVDGTGEELLEILNSEKRKIAESGVLKGRKNKPLQKITAEDFLFDIPTTWCWIRLGSVTEIFGRIGFRGYTKNDIVSKGNGAITISPSNILANGSTNFDDCTYLSWDKYEESPEIKVYNGDILLVKTGSSYGKCGIVRNLPEKATINPQLAILKYITCNTAYLDYVLKSPMARSQFESFVIGTSIPTFSQEKLANLLLPLPPLAEQKRIVAKLEEILPLIDRYEAAWNKLEEFNKRFPGDMQKSILQLAIQGKLVEQRPEEGTGEELLQQIQAEKQALIKAGKIKKEKPLPEIAEDEIPFDLPENWRWVRLGRIVKKLTDGSHNPPPNSGSGYPVISAKNVKNGLITFENVDRFTDEAGFEKENPRTNISRGDVILGIIGGSIGNIAVYTHDRQVIAQRSIAIIESMIDTGYFVYVLKSPLLQNAMQAAAAGSAQGGVYLGTLSNFLVPLPPLA